MKEITQICLVGESPTLMKIGIKIIGAYKYIVNLFCWIIFLNNPCKQCWYSSEAYSQSIQTSKIGLLAKVVNGWKPFAIFTKGYLLDVWVDSECASIVNNDNENQWFNLLFFQKNMRDSTQYSKACVQFSCFEYESSFTNPLLLY